MENKIPDASSLVTKTDYNTKISELEKKLANYNHDEYITFLKFNTLTVFNARLAQVDLTTKRDFDARMSTLNTKIISNKTKDLLAKNGLKKLKAFDLGYFIRKRHFDEVGSHNYLVFHTVN